ncbi:MAG: DUF2238 domain-containing protein [Caldilineaceae bacterium]|nr:DUF2238 domain-containing protein [Caldilineaceae bacterium]
MRRHPFLAAFTIIYIVGWSTAGLMLGRPQVWAYAAWIVAAGTVVVWADHHVRFSTTVLAILSVVGFAHMAGGNITVQPSGDLQFAQTVLYAQSWWEWIRYDLIIHFFGLGAVGIAASEALQKYTNVSTQLRTLTAVLAANAAGAWVEIGEYFITLINPEALVGDYQNNMTDLIANLAGSLTAAWWTTLPRTRRSKLPPHK